MPLSEAPLSALLLPALPLLVVLAEAAGLWGGLGSLLGSSLTVGTFPRPPALHFLLSAGCLLCWEISPSGWASASVDSLGALWLPACFLWLSLQPQLCESSCLSPWFLPFRGPIISRFVPQFGALSESLTLSIPHSFLVESLSAYAVALSVALWLCPGVPSAFLCFGLVCRSRSEFRPSHAVSLLPVSVLCVRLLLQRGVSPCVGVRCGSTFIAWSVSVILPFATWSSGRCFILFLRVIPHVFMAINLVSFPDLCVSQL